MANEKRDGFPAKSGLRGGENNVSKNLIVQPSFGVDWSNLKGVNAFTSFADKNGKKNSNGGNNIHIADAGAPPVFTE